MKQTKIESVNCPELDIDTFNGSLDEVIDNLIKIKSKYIQQYQTLDLIVEQEEEYYDHSHLSIKLRGERLETDKEYNHRITIEERNEVQLNIVKAVEEQNERELYRKLKEKYEK